MTDRETSNGSRVQGLRAQHRAVGRAVASLMSIPALLLMVVAATAAPLRTPAPAAVAAEEPTNPETRKVTYRFGVFPYLPALKMDKIFGPVALSLANDLGVDIHLRTKSTFEKFAEELASESYDIIFVHPFFYIEAHDSHNYLPLARLDEPLAAVVMVAEDSPLRGVADLKGKTVALPPPLAGVSELTRAALIDAGLRPDQDVTLRHFRTKLSCLQAVALGTAEACAIPNFLFRQQLKALGEMRLRPLFETPAINHLVFAVHARVPEAHRRALLACILRWPDTEEGRNVMTAGTWTRFVEARDEDYDQARRHRARLQAYGEWRTHARR